jgi:hypothetical protein
LKYLAKYQLMARNGICATVDQRFVPDASRNVEACRRAG